MSEQRWQPPAYNYSSEHTGARVVTADGWEGAGRRGWVIGSVLELYENGTQRWVPVLWDGEEDPDWVKATSLKAMTWAPFGRAKEGA